MTTKQRIINQAIKLYNDLGVANVTNRDIAKKLGISHGNLDYHYANKEALLLAIYKQMKKDASAYYREKGAKENPFVHFHELLMGLEKFHEKYLFFHLDVLEISRKYEAVGALLKKTFLMRKSQMINFHKQFADLGYFVEEENPDVYLRLQHTIRIIITFWCSQKEILPYSEAADKASMSLYVWELMIPHMTEKGLQAYENLISTKAYH